MGEHTVLELDFLGLNPGSALCWRCDQFPDLSSPCFSYLACEKTFVIQYSAHKAMGGWEHLGSQKEISVLKVVPLNGL